MKYGFSSSELQISDNVIQFVYSYFTFVLLILLLILKMNRLNLLNTNFDERSYQNHGPRKDVCRFAICFTFICKQHDFQVSQGNGYIDVGDKWMLLTLFWWQFLDVSDRISILVTFLFVDDKYGNNRRQHLKVVINTFRLQHTSPASSLF